MMRNPLNALSRGLAAVAALAAVALGGNAQSLRTTYFMDGVQYRLQLNPALAPTRGFVHLPAISNTGASLRSNSLNVDDVIDIMENKENADYYVSDKFMNRLDADNRALANANADVLAAGWWQGRNFWSFNVGVKVDGGILVPRELFSFMRDMKGVQPVDYTHYSRNIGKEELNLNAYAEIGLGFTRQFNERLSAGVRVKGLVGIGNINLKVNSTTVNLALDGMNPTLDWSQATVEDFRDVSGTASIDVDAEMQSSFEGMKFLTNSDGYINDVEMKARDMSPSGFGAAIDLGVAYRVADAVTLSAAINDLGFIKWSEGSTQVARANTEVLSYDSSQGGDAEAMYRAMSKIEALNPDMMRLTLDDAARKSRRTSLASTLVLGADYAFAGDKLSVGALFTNHFAHIRNEAEVTLSFNYRPSSLVNLSASYSPIISGGQSVGVALKLGPIFIGTDYLYMGKKGKCSNALVGISIPLGEKPEI